MLVGSFKFIVKSVLNYLCLYFVVVNVSMNISMINMTSPSPSIVSMTMTPDHTGECFHCLSRTMASK